MIELALAGALARDPRVLLVDASIVRPAIRGIGYDGSINLSKDEARKLGGAIGCDFFFVGKTETLTRSNLTNESHEEAYAGMMLVNGRTGALVVFDLISRSASTKSAALQALVKSLDDCVTRFVDRLVESQVRTSRTSEKTDGGSTSAPIEDVPAEDSARARGFKPPEFQNRVKPEYTAQAELADITATVEAKVVFRSDGRVGEIEITRWAGFGLDESAQTAIRQLKFNPATRDGNPLHVRALIRYNFRRVNEPLPKDEGTKETEGIKETKGTEGTKGTKVI
jgi:TonB family protein